MKTKLGHRFLTVVFRNFSPTVNFNEPVSHRKRTIELTEDQRRQLAIECTHTSGMADYYEEISLCILGDDA